MTKYRDSFINHDENFIIICIFIQGELGSIMGKVQITMIPCSFLHGFFHWFGIAIIAVFLKKKQKLV